MGKKIAKLTWLHNGNYGTVLQAFALQKYLEKNGFDVTDIDYKASLTTKLLNWWKNKNSIKLFVGKFKELKHKDNQYEKKFNDRAKKFDDFMKQNMKLTTLCRSPQDLKEISDKFDIFICGSDQIWSPALMNPVFYFDFVDSEKIKIAYAPSFGVVNTTEKKKEQIKGYIEKFKYLSVRETQGQTFINQLIDKDVPVEVDPTMLIDKCEWEKYAKDVSIKEPFIFCYLLTENETYLQEIRRISKEKGLKVVIIPTAKGPFDTGFEQIIDAGPAEWLGYIKNAELVCTDSFHGCIFSSIFNREFILFKRFSDTSKASENSRVYTLTKMLYLEDRLIDEKNISNIEKLAEIDFSAVNEIIRQESDRSGKWILDILEVESK